MTGDSALLAALFFAAALLYSSVGHAGGSGYLAAMAMVGVAPATMRPMALVTNVLVGSIATVRYARAGCFSWRTFWPFAAGSVPLAFLGGRTTLADPVYLATVGALLVLAALRLAWTATVGLRAESEDAVREAPVWAGVTGGAVLGYLAGLTGTGGGILLSPVLLFAGWATMRRASAVAAAFILVNSLAGVAADPSAVGELPAGAPYWAGAACAGGLLGSELGARRLSPRVLRLALAIVLVAAGSKLIF